MADEKIVKKKQNEDKRNEDETLDESMKEIKRNAGRRV
jgi:hypothetical protein